METEKIRIRKPDIKIIKSAMKQLKLGTLAETLSRIIREWRGK
jgi:hypothetical protein